MPCHKVMNNRKEIKYLVAVFLAIIIPLMVCQLYYEIRVRPRLINFQKLQELINGDAHPEVVILSDSVGFDGIVRSELPKNFFDMTIGGTSFRYQYALLSAMLRAKKSVKIIVLSLGDYSIGDGRSADSSSIDDHIAYAKKDELAKVYSFTNTQYYRAWINHFIFMMNPIQTANFWGSLKNDMISLLGQEVSRETYLDKCLDNARGPHVDWLNRTREEQIRIMDYQFNDKLAGNLANPEMIDVLDQMLKLAADNGVEVVGVYFPTLQDWDIYLKKYDHELPRRIYQGKIHRIFDYSELYKKQPEMYSYDHWHLNRQAAKTLTKKLAKDISEAYEVRLDDRTGCQKSEEEKNEYKWPYLQYLQK